MNTLQDKIRGSLVGGAIGDALGYPVEFLSYSQIQRRYGERGIRKFQDFNREGKAVISDDTQMTLFTANGLEFGLTRFITYGGLGAGLKDYVSEAYLDWYETQVGVQDYSRFHTCWIRDIVELNVRRAPGNTCMSALDALKCRKEVHNDSKGCGGVMRVAPVGIAAAAAHNHLNVWRERDIVRLGGDCAEITHKHPLGYLPAAFMAGLVYRILISEEPVTAEALKSLMGAVYENVKEEYTTEREQNALGELWMLIDKAVSLARDWKCLDEKAIHSLGEGWTGDEALAIAIYCTIRHLDSFEDAVAAAVNHDGDSDSTGAICGNLIGAIVGYEAIPAFFKQKLELEELMVDIADDMEEECPITGYVASTPEELRWENRYVKIAIIGPQYHIMSEALRMAECKTLEERLYSSTSDIEESRIGYELALKVFDIESFDPYHRLTYNSLPYTLTMNFDKKASMPAFCYGFYDPKYSPNNDRLIFKLNLLCFKGKNPVIAIRDDCNFHWGYEMKAGLVHYEDKSIMEKYPDWIFYQIDPLTANGNFAVFTWEQAKDFSFEVAHLWEDGTLHRVYFMSC